MPVKNPSPALLERIRLDGVCHDTGVTAQWGYHPRAEAKVFLLEKDEGLPKGWSAAPLTADEKADA